MHYQRTGLNSKKKTGVIAGSGKLNLDTVELDETDLLRIDDEFGLPSHTPLKLKNSQSDCYLLFRHGRDHHLAPHKINYRANVNSLKRLGVQEIIAINTVGGISSDAHSGSLVMPDQLIDYSWGREHTFSNTENLMHMGFDAPYSESLRDDIHTIAAECGVFVFDGGVYGCTQGPRFETPAEITRMEKDGCTIVGMTGMPEASLAKELGINYASICLVVNPAAGRGEGIDFDEINTVSKIGMRKIERLLRLLLKITES